MNKKKINEILKLERIRSLEYFEGGICKNLDDKRADRGVSSRVWEIIEILIDKKYYYFYIRESRVETYHVFLIPVIYKRIDNHGIWSCRFGYNSWNRCGSNSYIEHSESVMRFALDKNADNKKITQIGTNILVIGMVIGLLIFPICHSFDKISQYAVFVYCYVISLAASQLICVICGGKNFWFSIPLEMYCILFSLQH